MAAYLPSEVPQEARNLANYVVFTFLKWYYNNVKTGKFEPFEYDNRGVMTADDMANLLVSAATGTLSSKQQANFDEIKKKLPEYCEKMASQALGLGAAGATVSTGAYAVGLASPSTFLLGLVVSSIPMAFGLLAAAPKYIDKDALAKLVESHFSAELTPVDLARLEAFKETGAKSMPARILVGTAARFGILGKPKQS